MSISAQFLPHDNAVRVVISIPSDVLDRGLTLRQSFFIIRLRRNTHAPYMLAIDDARLLSKLSQFIVMHA